MKGYLKEYLAKIFNFLHQLFNKPEEQVLTREYSGKDSFIAAISYLPFVCAAVLILRQENSEFVSFHARQALVILLLSLLLTLLLPSLLKIVAAFGGAGLLILGTFRALQGRKWYFPIVTELANTIEL